MWKKVAVKGITVLTLYLYHWMDCIVTSNLNNDEASSNNLAFQQKKSSKDACHMAGQMTRAVQTRTTKHFAASQLDQVASTPS